MDRSSFTPRLHAGRSHPGHAPAIRDHGPIAAGRGGTAVSEPVQRADCLDPTPYRSGLVVNPHSPLRRIPLPGFAPSLKDDGPIWALRDVSLGFGDVPDISGAGRSLEAEKSTSSSQRDPSGCASQATASITGGSGSTKNRRQWFRLHSGAGAWKWATCRNLARAREWLTPSPPSPSCSNPRQGSWLLAAS